MSMVADSTKRRLQALALAFSTFAAAGCGEGTEPGVATKSFATVSFLSGSLDRGGRGDSDGIGSQARFSEPRGVAFAPDGSLWVVEAQRGRVRRIASDRQVRTVTTMESQSPGLQADGSRIQYIASGPVAVRPSGEVHLAVNEITWKAPPNQLESTSRWAVIALTATGTSRVVARSPVSAITGGHATALAFDRTGRLFVADGGRCAVWRVGLPGSPQGAVEPIMVYAISPRGEGQPCGGLESLRLGIVRLTIDPQDRPVITLSRGDVMRLEADGTVSSLGGGASPAWNGGAMVHDPNGRLVLSDGDKTVGVLENGAVRVWVGSSAENGWRDGAATEARFSQSTGMAFDGAGNLYVADVAAHTVRRIDRAGAVSTWAGLAEQDAYRDGSGEQARFGWAFRLSAGRAGSLIAADPINRVIREILPDGRVTTLAGIPARLTPSASVDGPVATARFQFPEHALMAGDGSVWVSDSSLMRRVGRDGQVTTISPLGALGGSVTAMARDAAGRPVAMAGSFWPSDGPFDGGIGLYRWPTDAAPGSMPERLPLRWLPGLWDKARGTTAGGLCMDDRGAAYFILGHAVFKRGSDGEVTLWAGDPQTPGTNDGDATAARFRGPTAIACEADGLHVADTGNHTVRYIDAQGRVSTALGQAGRPGVPSESSPVRLDRPFAVVPVAGGLAVGTGLGIVLARH